MVARQTMLDLNTTGDGPARSRFVSLVDALELQKRNADRLALSLKAASAQAGALGAVTQSANAKLGSLTNTIGPLGARIGHLGRQAPLAATGLFQLASAAERTSLRNRALNTTIPAGLTATRAAGVTLLAMADDAIRAGATVRDDRSWPGDGDAPEAPQGGTGDIPAPLNKSPGRRSWRP